jgi:hypothetical protein
VSLEQGFAKMGSPPQRMLNLNISNSNQYFWFIESAEGGYFEFRHFAKPQALSITLLKHPEHIQSSITLPTRTHAIFSTLQGTQNPNTISTLQRAKNANNPQPAHPS